MGKQLELEFDIDIKNDVDESPYCKICSGCGEDGCCSALICKHSEEGSYCKTYLADLKFGYLMYHDMYSLIKDPEDKLKLDEIFHKNYDLIYKK